MAWTRRNRLIWRQHDASAAFWYGIRTGDRGQRARSPATRASAASAPNRRN